MSNPQDPETYYILMSSSQDYWLPIVHILKLVEGSPFIAPLVGNILYLLACQPGLLKPQWMLESCLPSIMDQCQPTPGPTNPLCTNFNSKATSQGYFYTEMRATLLCSSQRPDKLSQSNLGKEVFLSVHRFRLQPLVWGASRCHVLVGTSHSHK